MVGRASQLDQQAAISRIGEIAEKADIIQAHLHEIVTSRAFRGSRRSCEFLEFVVGKALAGEFDLLKERTLGVRLFQRDPSYDTSDDAIVRVTASDVRKRLLQFYGGTRAQPAIRIELPPGSYIVQFRRLEDIPERLQTVLIEPPPGDPKPSRPPKWPNLPRLAVGAAAALLLMVCAWVGMQGLRSFTAANCLPWSAILLTNRPVKIVFSDPNIATFQHLYGYQLSLADYAARRYLPESPALPAEAPQVLKVLRGDNVAAVDANTVLRIGALVPPSRIQTFRARTLQAGDFKTDDNFILLGSPASNPWVALFQDVLDFEFQYDTEHREEVIRNVRPAPGESATYTPTAPGWGTGQAFAIAALLANPNQSGRVMILSGSNAAATEAAGKFVANPGLVAQTLKVRRLDPRDEQLQFEILLRVTTVAASLNTFDVVACHRLSPGSTRSE